MADPEHLYEKARKAHHSGSFDEALRIIERAEAATSEYTDLGLRVEIAIEHANLLRMAGREKKAMTVLNWVLALVHSDRREEIEEAATAFYIVRAYLEFIGAGSQVEDVDYDGLQQVIDDGLHYLEESGLSDWRDGLLCMRANIHTAREELELALVNMKEAFEVAENSSGSPGFGATTYLRDLAWIHRRLDQNEEAVRLLRGLLRRPRLSNVNQLAAHTYLGHALLDMGDIIDAAAHAESAHLVAAKLFPKQRMAALGLLVEARIALRDLDGAQWAANQILGIAKSLNRPHSLALANLDNAEVALAKRELDSAESFIDAATTYATQADERRGAQRYTTMCQERSDKLRRLRSIRSLQEELQAAAVPKTRDWWNNYLKGAIEFRGVNMAENRRITARWATSLGLEPEEIAQTALVLLEEEFAEDKLAGVLLFEAFLVESDYDPTELLESFQLLFDYEFICDWNTTDWLCVKVLGKFAKRMDPEFARKIMAWKSAKNLWRRRAAGVAFVNLAEQGDSFYAGFSSDLLKVCARTIKSQERFAQTGTGWVLRELAKADRTRVLEFVDIHLADFTAEGLKYALEKLPDDLQRMRAARKKLVASKG